MKVFISSLEAGYEPYRAAAAHAVEALGHEVVRAERLPVSPATPQQACLAAVRESDLVVLVLGERYGDPQPSGLSATHEEYREARERRPVLLFVQSGVPRDATQQAFLNEVEGWSTGHFRARFSSPEELKTAVLRGLHEYQLATVAGPLDESEVLARANALLPRSQNDVRGVRLVLAVAAGPYQQVLRPAELEQDQLRLRIQREAMFGEHTVLDANEATRPTIRGGVLVLDQPDGSLAVDEAGSVCIVQPAQRRLDWRTQGFPALIEEDLVAALARAVRFTGWILDHVDPQRRLTDVVPIASLSGAAYVSWRTRAEHAASPNSASLTGTTDLVTATLTPARRHRQALTHDFSRITEDMITLLRRQIRS